jgi:hypothetical protein
MESVRSENLRFVIRNRWTREDTETSGKHVKHVLTDEGRIDSFETHLQLALDCGCVNSVRWAASALAATGSFARRVSVGVLAENPWALATQSFCKTCWGTQSHFAPLVRGNGQKKTLPRGHCRRAR